MSESASNLRRESVDLITSQLSQSLADSIEEAVNKSNNHFEFIPEIIRESHSCMCNTRKLMSILGQDSVSSERQNAGEPIVASRPADANIQSSSSTPVAPGSSSSSSSISIAHSIASGSSCYTDPCSPLETIRLLMKTASQEKSVLTGQRHRPIIVVGPAGVGKSSLLSQVYTYCSEWLSSDSQVIKVVRHIGQSPSSSYTSELIRSLCIDITLVYGFEMRTDIVYELSSLSLWFHDLLKQIETTCPTNDLVIVLDDLHLLKSLQTSTILGWLPWTLPPSVHLICSVTEESDAVVSLLKSRIPSDNVIKLTPLESTAKILSMILCRLRGYTSIVDQQNDIPDQPSSKPNETLLPEKVWHLLSERFNAIVKTNPVTPLYVSLLTDTLLVPLICTPNSSEPSTRPSNLPGQEVTPSSGSIHATDSTSQTTEVNLKMSDIPITIDELIEKTVDELQKSFPCSTIDRLLTYLSGTRYGLREEELIDLIGNGDETGNNNKHDSDRKQSTCESENDSSDKNNETCSNVKEDNNLLSSLHQFESNSIWPAIKAKLNPFLKEYFILGRPYIHWSHRIICETIKQRYIVDTFDYKTIHSKLADAFLLGFNEVLSNRDPQDKIYRNDSSDMLREIDELWFHLLSCEDIYKLKHNALLNIDFMMSAVQSSSISYYRSVLELVRGKIIDWEVDLLYHMTKQSVNIVSQNTDQLSIEILLWLRPFAAAIADSTSGLCINQLQLNYPNKDSLFSSSNNCDQMGDKESHSNAINVKTNASKNINNSLTSSTLSPINRFAESKYLENLVRDTVNWCARYSGSLLIPINSWLHLPLPMQVSVISCPYAITRATLTNDHQNLIFCNKRSIHFFNLASKTLLKSVQGHRETITCLDISSSGRYLVTGSEDTSVILWEIDADGEIECNSRYSLGHHVAGVLCTAITHNEEYILSGSEIGAICVVRLDSGLLIGRLEHHRGMITCIKVNLEDDIFAAGSTDCSVSIWSLDTFCVLNQIFLPKAILHMDISMDSTFLMLALEDNKVHIRALTTGSEVHILQEHQSNSIVSYVKFAEDSSRAILGTGDGKLHIYDVHSAHLIQTLTSHQDMITSIISQPCDKYLVTCGTCKVIIWNFYPRKKVDSSLGASSGPVTNLYATLGNPNNYSSSTNNLTSSANNVSNVLVNSSNETSNTVINSSTNNVNNVSNIVMSNNNSTTATNMNNNNNNSNNFTNNNDNIMNTATSTVNNNGINSNYNVTSISSNNNTVNVISVSNGSNMGVNSVCRTSVSRTTSNRTDHESSNKSSRSSSLRVKKFDQHKDPITCLAVSRDGTYAVTGSRDSLVKVWNLSSGETHATLSGHSAPITCVSFSPNGFFCVSGSEDKTVRVWSLTLGLKVFVYPDHSAAIDSVFVSTDSRRILSIDCQGFHRLWQADSGNTLVNVAKLTNKVTMFGNTVFAVGGKNDNSLRYWSVYEPDLEKSVSHSEPITCYTCTYDCSTIITGSQDMSLKVWEVSTGKLTQVLVGHEEPISCVSSAPMVQSMVVSGSQDCNLIVWDTTTGNVTFTLTGHTATILSVQLSIDGRVAVSASEDNTIMAWNALETGQRIALVDIHHTISSIGLSLSLNQIVVQLKNNNLLPIIKFHNNPAKTLDLPPPGTPSNEDKFSSHLKGFLTGSNRRLIGRGNLKREQSFDSFCWDQLHRGVSIDDFRKISALQQTTGSPLGSREHLATTGIIWDGASGSSVASGVTSVTDRNINRLLRLSNKPAGPKQKMLKKQQSMFAFFPEHSPPPVTASTLVSGSAIGPVAASLRGPSPLVSSTVSAGSSNPHTSGTLSGLPDSLSRSLIKQASPIKVTTSRGPPSRSQSLEDTQTGPVNTASTLAHQTEPATSKAQDK